MNNALGSVNINGGTLTSTGAGNVINVNGGSNSLTFAGNINQSGSGSTVNASGHSGGSLIFNTGILATTNGNGLQFNDADGTYTFNGTTTLNGGDAGIDITNGSAGSFTFGTNTSITNPTGTGLNVNGSAATVNYQGSIAKNTAGNIVTICLLYTSPSPRDRG